MEEFYKIIHKTLKNIGVPVFHDEPERGATRPFITYSVNERSRTDNPRILSLSVIVEDSSPVGEEAEYICTDVDLLFDRNVLKTDNYIIRFLRQARNNLGDPEPMITRIEINYQLRVFNKQ